MKLIIINGPNLNLTGTREKDVYGSETFEELIEKLRKEFPEISLDYFQSNIEGEIINKLHETGFNYDGIIINPGGYSHTSVAIADAIAAIKTPVTEVHITNIYARENYRHQSLTGAKCKGVISGFGLRGYALAVNYFINS
jgi:3-dehydroquinate dehydratase II